MKLIWANLLCRKPFTLTSRSHSYFKKKKKGSNIAWTALGGALTWHASCRRYQLTWRDLAFGCRLSGRSLTYRGEAVRTGAVLDHSHLRHPRRRSGRRRHRIQRRLIWQWANWRAHFRAEVPPASEERRPSSISRSTSTAFPRLCDTNAQPRSAY